VPHRLGYETQGPYNDRRQTLALSVISRSMRLWAAKKPTARRPAIPPPSGMRVDLDVHVHQQLTESEAGHVDDAMCSEPLTSGAIAANSDSTRRRHR
jgi:hypothetical protein